MLKSLGGVPDSCQHRPHEPLPGARRVAAALLIAGLALPPGAALADIGDGEIAAVIDEGLNRSEIMTNASALFDGIGARLTNSENFRRAAGWAVAKFAAYGLSDVHREPYYFGLGWNLESHSARMVEPRVLDLTEIPVAWSPPTKGILRAPVIVAPMSKPDHFARWRGELAGRIVLVSLPGTGSEGRGSGQVGTQVRRPTLDLRRFDP